MSALCVCVCGGGGGCLWGGLLLGGCLLHGVVSAPGECLLPGGCVLRPPKMATATGGTHPTGMHSC